jgi:O-antigen ligase/tetratricopeptide (TPR) repeat protein
MLVMVGLFAVPFLTLYVENDYFFPFITGKNFWFRIIVDVVFAAWVLLALYDVKYRPRVSSIVWSFGVLLVVMFFANLFGKHPDSSFFSNFERMDGYMSLLHTFMYMLVLGSVLQTKEMWHKFLTTSVVVASLVALYGLAQYGGLVDGSNRIDSRLGNAAYMAIYMLFHIFLAFWLFVESKNNAFKVFLGLLVVMFTFVLIETGTRGTAVGLAVGVGVMSAYIGFFGTQFRQYRKYAIGGFALLLILASAFVVGRDSALVQNNDNLARIANISIADLEIRGIIWGMAWEGVKERPLLGYGQSNFNYVFNENYDPRLYGQEQWFDRAHNIFMDWLVTGGFLGLFAYLSIFLSAAYYLFYRPIFKKDETFNVLERGVLLGILAGYFTHNFVVFDNIVSYIFFAVILALINSRVGVVPKSIAEFKVDTPIINQFATPLVLAALVFGIYTYHVPGMQASADIIDGFRAANPVDRFEAFERAVSRDSLGNQEVVEQLAQQAMSIYGEEQVPDEIKVRYLGLAESELLQLAEDKTGDARVHVFIASYYRSVGQLDKAAEQMAIARDLSPQKQSIMLQQGFIALNQGDNDGASAFFKDAFELDERNLEAREYYASSLLQNDPEAAIALMREDERAKDRFARSNFFLGAANSARQADLVTELFEYRLSLEPDNRQNYRNEAQSWASLAFLYYQSGSSTKAIEILKEAAEEVPSFGETATCFISNLEAGNEPQAGCN